MGDGSVLAQMTRCAALLPAGMRWRWVGLIPLVAATAAFEAVGAAAVFGLIRVLTAPAQAAGVPAVSALLAWLPGRDERTVVVACTLVVALFYVVKNLLAAATAYAQSRCVEEATAVTATTMLRGYVSLPYAFHLRRNSAELIHNAEYAVQRVFSAVMAPALAIVTETLVALAIAAVLLAAAPRVTLVVTAVLLGLSTLSLRITRGVAVRLGRRMDVLGQTTLVHLQQVLGAIKEVLVLGRAHYFAERFAGDQRARARARYLHATLLALPRLVVETIFVCGALLVILLLTAGGATGPEAVPLIGLYAYAGFRIIPSMNRIVWQANQIRSGSAAIDRVCGDLAVIAGHAAGRGARPAGAACRFTDRIELERVSYVHDGDGRQVLVELSLTIHRGEAVGVIGPTGTGKSTLVDLIVGVLEPSSGRITVDGVDLRQCLPSWQRGIGYVPQTVFLIDDSLRRNIALGIPDEAIDEARIRAAARRAQLEPLIAALADGLDTPVGERGVRLSGGERQRVGIARALYHEPAVLVFDEATSALDGRTEAEVVQAIEALRGERTLIFVAHRLTTVRRCDRLVFVRDGRIADVGTFDELLARNAEFRDMAVAPTDAQGAA
jgi:ABC-type multidrug transport system fused ATPase/permease subunit